MLLQSHLRYTVKTAYMYLYLYVQAQTENCLPPDRLQRILQRSALSIIGRAGASPPSRTAAIIFLYIYIFIYLFIYLYPCRTSCPKSSTCFFFSDISIFLRRKCLYTPFFFSNLYAIHGAMRHGFVSHGRCRPLS